MTKVWHQQVIDISQGIGWIAEVLASYAKRWNLMINMSKIIMEQLKAQQMFFKLQIRDWQDNLIYRKYKHEKITKI